MLLYIFLFLFFFAIIAPVVLVWLGPVNLFIAGVVIYWLWKKRRR